MVITKLKSLMKSRLYKFCLKLYRKDPETEKMEDCCNCIELTFPLSVISTAFSQSAHFSLLGTCLLGTCVQNQ